MPDTAAGSVETIIPHMVGGSVQNYRRRENPKPIPAPRGKRNSHHKVIPLRDGVRVNAVHLDINHLVETTKAKLIGFTSEKKWRQGS